VIGSVAIIGFGEVGSLFARDLRAAGVARITAWDMAFADPAGKASANAAAAGIVPSPSAPTAVGGAELVISAVTAGSALEALRAALGALGHAPFVLDVNSVSPGTKRAAATAVTEAGGRYVEAAVMASVPPKGLRSPILLGGPHARAFADAAAPWGMDLTVYSEEVGRASAVKMCRSVMVKGLEALVTESLLAARRYGVEEDVLASLKDTLPHPDWAALARYVISRPLIHGKRRAEEMREVARTVAEVGVAPTLSGPIAERQDWAGAVGRTLPRELLAASGLAELLDAFPRDRAPTEQTP
jgi:3-hydroxyisobutyrate dehydrogenase